MPVPVAGASSEFRIFETEEFPNRLGKLPLPAARFIVRKLKDYVYPQLRADPFLGPNIRKLKGCLPDTWRYRIGRCRIFCLVSPEERIIALLPLDDRKDAYR
jgi:mRNA interferase RelE/StbE